MEPPKPLNLQHIQCALGEPALQEWWHLENTGQKGSSEMVMAYVGDPLGFGAGAKIRVSALGSIPRQQISEPGLSNLMGGSEPADN